MSTAATFAARGSRYLVAGPATEPLTPAEAKDHLRVDGTDEDALISALVTAAREQAEAFTRRAFVTQTWQVALDAFPASGVPIELPLPPLQSISSVTYVDFQGVTQTWPAGNYAADAPSGPQAGFGRLIPGFQVLYPTTQDVPNAVTIEFVAGYGDAAEVPAGIKQALLMQVGHLYANREGVVTGFNATELPESVKALLWPYRMLRL